MRGTKTRVATVRSDQSDWIRVCYVAAPLSGDIPGNLRRAKDALARFQSAHRDRAFIAPWIAWVEMGDDDDNPVARELGMQRDLAVIAKCDELWVVGTRVTAGMRREIEHAQACGVVVVCPGEP